MKLDIRPLRPQIKAPTLILHRKTDTAVPIEIARHLARDIPSARLIEQDSGDTFSLWATTPCSRGSTCPFGPECTPARSRIAVTTSAASRSMPPRVMAKAQAREVVVSRVVSDLVAGSGIGFADRGDADLKSLPGRGRPFAPSL